MNYYPVHAYDNYVEAHIAMGRLEGENIDCWLKDENSVTINPVLGNAVGGIKLMVHEAQVQRAAGLLQQWSKESRSAYACINCGSSHVELVSTPRKASNWFMALFGTLFGNYALSAEKVYHCFDCGFESKEVAEKKPETAVL